MVDRFLPHEEADERRRARQQRLATIGAAIAYLACTLVLIRDVLGRATSTILGGNDGYLFAWWVRWFPYAVTEGTDPFVTKALNFPVGANAMWNTSLPLLAALVSPITLTAGPILATNVLHVLGRRSLRSWPSWS